MKLWAEESKVQVGCRNSTSKCQSSKRTIVESWKWNIRDHFALWTAAALLYVLGFVGTKSNGLSSCFRPLRSLQSHFTAWMPQTANKAGRNHRLKVKDSISKALAPPLAYYQAQPVTLTLCLGWQRCPSKLAGKQIQVVVSCKLWGGKSNAMQGRRPKTQDCSRLKTNSLVESWVLGISFALVILLILALVLQFILHKLKPGWTSSCLNQSAKLKEMFK